MQFSTIFIAVLATLAAATPTPSPQTTEESAPFTGDSSVASEPYFEEPAGNGWVDGPAPSKRGLEVRGFGCPFNEMKCHNHCKSIKGRAGGYCAGWFDGTCTCYR